MSNWLITGVSSGFGLAIAQAALERGDVVAGTLRSPAAVAAFEALQPGRAIGLILDVTDPAAVRRVVADAEARTGGIDILVANAGRGLVGAIEETSLDEMRALFDVNVFGAISVIQATLAFMRPRRRGHVINITSVSGLAPWAGTGIYGATKYAMECIGQALAGEVAELGIKVTNVAPGGFRTGFAGGALQSTGATIADYAGAAHNAGRVLAGHHGSEPGDPVLAASAILGIAGIEAPPMHLLLGKDAVAYASGHLAGLQAAIAEWEAVSLSTAALP